MDLTAARTALARVNRLFDDLDDSGPSALERDLLKEYVRRLYESLSTATGEGEREAGNRTSTRASPRQAPRRSRVVEPTPPSPREELDSAAEAEPEPRDRLEDPAPAFAFEPSPAAVSRTDVEPTPPAAPERTRAAEPPRVFTVPESVEEEVREIESTRAARPANPPRPQSTAQSPLPVTPPVAEAPPMESPFAPEPEELPAGIRDLFALQSDSGDLSARLSASPVPDLSRAFGIGERMLIQKELFGGDNDAFSATLGHLNELPDYESAVAYLGGGAAEKYDWSDGERADVARDFARVVRRRYA